jgi:tRNA-guanine family transglycosylase
VDGTSLFLGPKESIRIQQKLGADIIFAFDECPSPLATEKYMRDSLERTHRWAKLCLDAHTSKQALYGIVQGGNFLNMRIESAKTIGALPFQGFGIGGEFGYDKRSLKRMLTAVNDVLPPHMPRHVLGVGHPEDFPYIATAGGDTFDCIAPTHYARRSVIFTSKGRINIRNRRFLTDKKPLDAACKCDICKTYSRAYICHLLRMHELTGMKLASYHNLYFFNAQARELRRRIKNGDL